MPRPFSLLDYYFTSIEVGLKSLTGDYPKEAAARVLNPLSYPRYMEYRLALEPLLPFDGYRLLAIGSPKLPVLLLPRHARCELHATDIRDYFIGPTRHFLVRMGLGRRIGREIHLEVQDARHLTYADAFFDRIFTISVIEHIPEAGDSEAMHEIARVLRPGGRLGLTVPFAAGGYAEEFVRGPIYERDSTGGETFYQRRYDRAALQARLLEPASQAGLQLLGMTFFGEPSIRIEPVWNRIPMRWKVPLLWAQPFVASVFLRTLGQDRLDAAVGVALQLQKQV